MRASLVNRSKNLGFTLIELMVVLIIIAIMSAMVIPEMQGTYEDAILRSASRDMVTVFNTASSRAIAVNQIHRVRFDLKTGHYSVERCVRERLRESEFAPLADVAGSSSAIDPRITLTVHRPGEDPNDTYEKDIFSDPPADEDSMDKTADAPANGIADRAPSMSSAQVVDTLSEDSEAS